MPLTPENMNAFLSYQVKVNGLTYARNEYRRPIGPEPTFTADEMEQMFEAFERGDDPEDFVKAIYKRDTRQAELMLAGTINS